MYFVFPFDIAVVLAQANTTDLTRAFQIRQVRTASKRTIRNGRPRARASLAVRPSSSQRGGRW